MENNTCTRVLVTVLIPGAIAYLFVAGCQASQGMTAISPEQRARLDTMKASGTDSSLTVFPVVMGDGAFHDVAGVVAVMLEQAGMKNLDTSEAVFHLPPGTVFADASRLFGGFVQGQSLETEYGMYTEFMGSPKTGPTTIRYIIVDRSGGVVLAEQQTKRDWTFARPKPECPMTSCLFVSERVRTRLGIPRSARDDSGEGKMAQRLAKASPAPGKVEMDAMKSRQAIMRRAGDRATMAIYPVRLGDAEAGSEEASHLAGLIAAKSVPRANAVPSALRVNIAPARNEQKLLWELARKFQAHLREHPPGADYALLADYIMHPEGERAWAVHFVVCDRAGDWVIVDFQNDHHADFQSVDPKTYEDCGRLVAKRLDGYVR